MLQWQRFLLFFLFSSCFFAINAQQSSIKFTHLTNLDGLSQSTVQAMLKDKYGFMWFGTHDGLNRYDGYTFKVYRHQPKDPRSLSTSNIMSLYEDRLGNLWVGTTNGALCLYDRKHDSFIRIKESNGNYQGLSQNSITAMYEDRRNNFWIGTYWQLNLLDRKTGKVTHFGHDPNDAASISNDGITSIFEDSHNNLWIGTSVGLNILDRKTKKFEHFLHDDSKTNSLSNDHVSFIKEDSRNRLWIGTSNGLNLFDPATKSFTNFINDPRDSMSITENRVTAIEEAGEGKLWIGTHATLELFDPEKRIFVHLRSNPDEPTSLNRNGMVMSMLYDKEKILWVGTYQGGINKYDKYLTYFDTYRNKPSDWLSLSFNRVTSFAEKANGDVWIGTDGGALNLWKSSTNQFVRFNPEPNNKNSLASWSVLCLLQSKKNDYLWIGSYGSCIDRYDQKTNTFVHYTKGDAGNQLNNDAVYAILEDAKGNIWMGTNGGGVNVLNPATGIITKYLQNSNDPNAVAGNYIRCFYEDKKRNIWIGSTTGLNRFDPVTGNSTLYRQGNTALESDAIFSLYEDKKGDMWIGTLGGGLSLLELKTNKMTTYTTNDGLPDNTINSIVEDDNGYLWLSTNNGISRFDPKKKSFKNSSLYNGIQSFEFSQGAGLKTSKGEILFGGVNGFNAFNPANLAENKNIPPVVIINFKLFNKSVAAAEKNSPLKQNITQTKEITLSYDQSIITFEFAALGFTASEKNQYAFNLEGFNEIWDTGYHRTATYTNLDPGEYTFKVKASNNDGVWNERAASIKIIITPPFWLTWWFKILAVLIIIGGTAAIITRRINNIEAQKANLQKQVHEQTIKLVQSTREEQKARHKAEQANIELEIKNKEMEQFAYIASHDLQEPLRTTSSFVKLLQKQYAGQLDERADKYFNFITDASDRMKVLIKNLLDYSRIGSKKELEQVDCKVVLKDVLADLHVAIQEAKADISYMQLPVISGYPNEIKQLFQNLLINAIKFRKQDTIPQVIISVQKIKNYWEFIFKDNGIGIEEKNREKIFNIFQRLHTRTEYEGSGIGLSYCKKIVELHNGKIWVESTPGLGSTFYFTIQEKIKNNIMKKPDDILM
ncbi:MAG: two-component regulator propeller domain-containing protein [Ginsengibacter sp.]